MARTLSLDIKPLLFLMIQRGGQSGGLVTLILSEGGQVKGLRERVCPTKRQHLAVLVSRSCPLGEAHPLDFLYETRGPIV